MGSSYRIAVVDHLPRVLHPMFPQRSNSFKGNHPIFSPPPPPPPPEVHLDVSEELLLNKQKLKQCVVGEFMEEGIVPSVQEIEEALSTHWNNSISSPPSSSWDWKVRELDDRAFLINFPSPLEAQEAILQEFLQLPSSAKKLKLLNWSPTMGAAGFSKRSKSVWVRLKKIPLHAWSTFYFIQIVSSFGKLMEIDRETVSRENLREARVRVDVGDHQGECNIPSKVKIVLEGNSYWVFISKDERPIPPPPSLAATDDDHRHTWPRKRSRRKAKRLQNEGSDKKCLAERPSTPSSVASSSTSMAHPVLKRTLGIKEWRKKKKTMVDANSSSSLCYREILDECTATTTTTTTTTQASLTQTTVSHGESSHGIDLHESHFVSSPTFASIQGEDEVATIPPASPTSREVVLNLKASDLPFPDLEQPSTEKHGVFDVMDDEDKQVVMPQNLSFQSPKDLGVLEINEATKLKKSLLSLDESKREEHDIDVLDEDKEKHIAMGCSYENPIYLNLPKIMDKVPNPSSPNPSPVCLKESIGSCIPQDEKNIVEDKKDMKPALSALSLRLLENIKVANLASLTSTIPRVPKTNEPSDVEDNSYQSLVDLVPTITLSPQDEICVDLLNTGQIPEDMDLVDSTSTIESCKEKRVALHLDEEEGRPLIILKKNSTREYQITTTLDLSPTLSSLIEMDNIPFTFSRTESNREFHVQEIGEVASSFCGGSMDEPDIVREGKMSESGEQVAPLEKINEQIHEYREDSSSSDSENEKDFYTTVKKKHLFGRKEPVHTVLGGGKSADIILWRNKQMSASIVAGVTTIWLLFEWMGYHLLTLTCYSLILALAVLFIWSNASSFINKAPPKFPEVTVPEDMFLDIARSIRHEINEAFYTFRYVAEGKDLRKFLMVVAGLWILSIVGSWFNFLTLFYIVFVILYTVPVLYEKYEDHVDLAAEKAMIQVNKHYEVLDAKVLQKIPKASFLNKKQQ